MPRRTVTTETSPRSRNAERTRTTILDTARRLFAERGITTVGLRDIATAAGISHGLIQYHFGTREKLVAAIIQREIDIVTAEPATARMDLDRLREYLRDGADDFRDFACLILRAELAGLEPEKMLDRSAPTPSSQLAEGIASLQANCPPERRPALDPKMVSAYVNAALFGFAALSPWLMTSVGLKPKDYAKSKEEIANITLALIEMAGGIGRR